MSEFDEPKEVPEFDNKDAKDSLSLHPLDEILPLSKPQSEHQAKSAELIHKETSKNSVSQFKEWMTQSEVRTPPQPSLPSRNTKRKVWLGVGSALIVAIIVCLVLSVFFAVRGSRLAVSNYFSTISPEKQVKLASQLLAEARGKSGKSIAPFASPDVNLKAAPLFDGIVYSPKHTMEPTCGYSAQDATLDLALLSSITSKIRIYGTQCNQAAFILDAIQLLDSDMTLMMGIWISDSEEANEAQIKEAKMLLSVYPPELFEGVMVGNEALFRNDISESKLIDHILDLKAFLAAKKLDIPVGTSEMGSMISAKLFNSLDVVGVNLLPFFTGLSSEDAAQWTSDYLTSEIIPLNRGNSSIVISEVGWPYSGGKYHDSVADPVEYQRFLHSSICHVSKNLSGVKSWYYYEAFDEPWKAIFHDNENQWETEWGLFGRYRDMKTNVSFPAC